MLIVSSQKRECSENMEKRPVYIKIDAYNDVLDVIALARSKIQQAKTLQDRLEKLHSQEEEHLKQWQEELQNIEHNLEELDSTLARPQQ